MARKPHKRNLTVTVTFVEDQEEAMETFTRVVKYILFKEDKGSPPNEQGDA